MPKIPSSPHIPSTPPVPRPQASPPQTKSTAASSLKAGDQLQVTTASDHKAPQVKLFEPQENASKSGWKIKTAHFNFGYVLDNNVVHSGPMQIRNAEHGTDLTISEYQQIDRKNWEYLKIEKGQRFAPDEPQFNLGVNLTFENNFGVELDAKHNKIIMDGYDQTVHLEGTHNGQEINSYAPLNTVMRQHEQTLGNMQISALATYNLALPSPGKHRFSLISKAGPNLITSNTRFQFKEPDGNFNGGTGGLEVVGYGATLENGLRYQFGPKVGQLGLELTHSLSYLNYAHYETVNGYTGSHSALNNSFALKATVGIAGNKK